LSFKREYIPFSVLGFLGISSVTSYIFKGALGIPYIPLVGIIILSPIVWKESKLVYRKIKSGASSSQVLLVTIGFWVLLVLIGLFNSGSVQETLSVSRVSFYIILSAYVSSNTSRISTDKLFFLCLGIVLGDIFNSFFLSEKIGVREVSNFNIVPIFVLCSIATVKGRPTLIFTSLVLVAISTYASAYRVVPLVGVGTVIYTFVVISLLRNKNKNWRDKEFKTYKFVFTIAIATGVIIYLFTQVEVQKFRYYRLVVRMQELIEFDLDSAIGGRVDVFRNITDDLFRYILPNGFATTSEYIETADGSLGAMRGYHKDFPIIFFAYTFGLPLSLIVLFGVLGGAVNQLRKFLARYVLDEVDVVSFAFIPLFIVMMMFNGRFLFFPFAEGAIFGTIIGRWFR
jgi:hypothetical protein